LEVNPSFSVDVYMHAVQSEFRLLGMQVSIREKQNTNKTNIESAFLKSETIWKELILDGILPQHGMNEKTNIKIKLEVDTKPLLGFETEEKLLLKPFSFYIKCFTLSNLFAGKMHALLFRKWKNNVKGRDWYDMECYIRRGTPLNLHHFLLRAKDSGDWNEKTITEEAFRNLLEAKINSVNFNRIKADIGMFTSNPEELDIWSSVYFNDLVRHLKVDK
jgi:hypothetical protein